jgi:hypothetical protein
MRRTEIPQAALRPCQSVLDVRSGPRAGIDRASSDSAISSEGLADGPAPTGPALAGRDAVSLIGYGLILPFEIIYLHQIRGFATATASLMLAAIWARAPSYLPPTGPLLDQSRPKPILIAGNLTRALGYAGFASRGDCAPGRVATVFAIGECVHAVVLGPLVADLAPPHPLGRYVSLHSLMVTARLALGPAIGGVVLATSPDAVWWGRRPHRRSDRSGLSPLRRSHPRARSPRRPQTRPATPRLEPH